MPSFSTRPTMRSLAAAAGVSAMTISLALRDDPSIPLATRNRIQRLARQQGYRPDPLLAHLMQHLRTGRTARFTGNLAVIATLDAEFTQRLIAGATARAGRLGYGLDRINVKPFIGRPAALTRTLRARGIAGVLLAPSGDPADYTHLLDWQQFAVVAMTYSVYAPRVHRVVTHHFDNAVRVFDLLQQRGFERIGLAMTNDMEFRANHSYSGAYARITGDRPTGAMPILYLDTSDKVAIARWFARHRPEVVVVANSEQVERNVVPALGAKRAAQVAFACLDNARASTLPGIDQLFEIIGGHAVDALVGQIHRNDRGVPAHPTISMVEGQWVEPTRLEHVAPKRAR